MIVFYNRDTLEIAHVISQAADQYVEYLQSPDYPGDPFIISSSGPTNIDELEVLPGPVLAVRQPMALDAPTHCTVDVECVISGIPEGATISVNGEERGTMDGSGVLEFTAETPGPYRFYFACSGYIRKEITVEAHP